MTPTVLFVYMPQQQTEPLLVVMRLQPYATLKEGRQMKRLLRSSIASPYGSKKNNCFGRIQTHVSCVLRRSSGHQYSSIDSQGMKQGLKVPMTVVVITPILLTCFAHVCIPIPLKGPLKKLGILNEECYD